MDNTLLLAKCVGIIEVKIKPASVKGFDIGRGEKPEERKKEEGANRVIVLTDYCTNDRSKEIEDKLRRRYCRHSKFRGETSESVGHRPFSNRQKVYLLLFT